VIKKVHEFAAVLPPLIASTGMAYLFMSCGGSDKPAPPPPPAVTFEGKSLEGHHNLAVEGSIEVSSKGSIGNEGVKVEIEGNVKGHIAVVYQTPAEGYFDNNSMVPLQVYYLPGGATTIGGGGGHGGSGQDQVGTQPKQDAIRLQPAPQPDEDFFWISGKLTLPQLDQSTRDAINAGGEPIRFFFEFPFLSQIAFESYVDMLFIQVFDENVEDITDSLGDVELRDANPLSIEKPPVGPGQYAYVMAELVNAADGSPVTPEQLGLDQAERSLTIGFMSEDRNEFEFSYGAGLWYRLDKQGNEHGTGWWAGWHASSTRDDVNDGVHASIADVQSGGVTIGSAAPGDVIDVIVNDGYDLPFAAVFVGNEPAAMLSATPGPGADQMTYSVQVAPDAVQGSDVLYFKNHGATKVWNPDEVGPQVPSIDTTPFTVL